MNVKFINPLLESTIRVLNTMAFMEIEPGKPQIKKDKTVNGDVTGLIDLKGAGISGWMALSFEKATILGVVKNMLGDDLDDIDETVADCVGEITNMVTGGAKADYANLDIDIDLARPVVLVGRDQELECSQPGQSILLPFRAACGTLCLEFFFN